MTALYVSTYTHIYLYILPEWSAHTLSAQPAYTYYLRFEMQCTKHILRLFISDAHGTMYLVLCKCTHQLPSIAQSAQICSAHNNITSLNFVSSVRHLFSFISPAVLNTFTKSYLLKIKRKLNFLNDYDTVFGKSDTR